MKYNHKVKTNCELRLNNKSNFGCDKMKREYMPTVNHARYKVENYTSKQQQKRLKFVTRNIFEIKLNYIL